MSKEIKRFSLILLLAFLQCLAPLLHAHPMGTQIAGGIHLHEDIEWSGMEATGHPASSEIGAATTHELPAISMAKEHKLDSAVAVADPISIVCRHAADPAKHPSPVFPAPLPFFLPPSFSSPCSQAPPPAIA